MVQELTIDGARAGAVLGVEPDRAVVLVGAAWTAYERIGGGSGLAAGLVGYPTSTPELDDGLLVVPLSKGVALIAQTEFGPFFWLPDLALSKWTELGGQAGELGMPISDPYTTAGGLRQDYVNGHMTLDGTGRFSVVVNGT